MADAGFPEPGLVRLPIYTDDNVYAPFRLYSYETDEDGNPVRDDDGDVIKTYVDLTDVTITAQVRRHTAKTSPVLLELTVDVPTQTGDDVGRFNVTATAEETVDLPLVVARWDVQLDDGETRRTWIHGPVPITGDVSREEEGS